MTLGEAIKQGKIKGATINANNNVYEGYTPKKSKKETFFGENIVDTVGSGATYIAKGFLGSLEGTTDWARNRVGQIGGLLGNKDFEDEMYAQSAQDTTGFLLKPATDIYDKTAIKKDGILANVLQGVGQIGALAGSTGLGIPGPLSTGLSSAGSGEQEALSSGASRNQALGYSVLKGGLSAGTEYISGGIGGVLGKGAIDGVITDKLVGYVSSQVGKKLLNFGLKSAFEGLEENLEGIIDPLIKRMTYDKNAQGYFTNDEGKFTLNKLGSDFLVGALTSAIVQSPNTILNLSSKTPYKSNAQIDAEATLNGLLTTDTSKLNETQLKKHNQKLDVAKIKLFTVLELDKNNQSQDADASLQQQTTQTDTNIPTTPQTTLETAEKVVSEPVTNETSKLKVTELKDNYLKPLKTYSDKMYRETNADGILDIINPLLVKNITNEDIYLSNNIDLAKGQGNNKGIIIKFNSANLQGKVNTDKPTFDFNLKNGNAEFIAKNNNQQSYRDAVESITITKELKVTPIQKKQLQNSLKDWKSIKNEDGSITYTKPTIEQQFQQTQPLVDTKDTTELTSKLGLKKRGLIENVERNEFINNDTKQNIKDMELYVPEVNEKVLKRVDESILRNNKEGSYDNSYAEFKNMINDGKVMNADGVGLGLRLYQMAFDSGNINDATDILTSLAVVGTQQGQGNQMMSLVKNLSPAGRLMMVEKLKNRAQLELTDRQKSKMSKELNTTELKISDEAKSKILKATNTEQLDLAVSDALIEIGKQIPAKLTDSIRSFRYASMLVNPTTHIRNMASNATMALVARTKNKIAGGIEDVWASFDKDIERTRTLKNASPEVMEFAKQQKLKDKDLIQSGNKFGAKTGKVTSIPTKTGLGIANPIAEGNTKLLGLEDWINSGPAYARALANYITANNYTVEFLNSGTKEAKVALDKGRQLAIQEAQEQTFNQANKVAEAISKLERTSAMAEIIVGGAIPFKKTTLNMLETGIEYSPASIIKFAYDVKTKSPSQAINTLSKGLTGSSIMMLGAYLASMGILSGGGDEDEENINNIQGKQKYSINIGNKSYTLDWLSPSAIPLFTGANLFNEYSKGNLKVDEINKVMSTFSTLLDPLTNMTVIEGANNILQSYGTDVPFGQLGDIFIKSAFSYAGQFVPQIGSKINKTFDPLVRTTAGEGTGFEKRISSFIKQQQAKIPGLYQQLEPKSNQFGEVQREDNMLSRAIMNFISPGKMTNIKTDVVGKELYDLYQKTKDSSVIPSYSGNTFTYRGEDYRLEGKDYTEFNKVDGTYVKNRLDNLISGNNWENMSEESRINAVKSIYEAGQKYAKSQYLQNK